MARNEAGGTVVFDWATVTSLLVNPVKVGIVEGLWRVDQPLSAGDLKEIFDGREPVSAMSYHLGYLAKVGVVAKVEERQSRGSLQKFYSLA